jgi:integrase
LSAPPELLPPATLRLSSAEQLPADPRPDLLTLGERSPDDPLFETAQRAAEFIRAAKAPATRRAYDSDWRHFTHWCETHRLAALPALPQTVALYLTDLAQPAAGEKPKKPATITRRLTAINAAHKAQNLDSPATMNHRVVAATFHGIRRTLGTAQNRKRPLTRDRLVRVLDHLEGPIAAARDKALLLVGFAGALRRSELAAMRCEHLHWGKRGLSIQIPRSKTDQEGAGRAVEMAWGANPRTCPLLALENWLRAAGITSGPVFRRVSQYGTIGQGSQAMHPDSIGRRVKQLVGRAKLAHAPEYGGHSLRAGFVTEASANGATNDQIMKQTGHTTDAMVRRYARGDREDRLAAESKLGL